MKTYFTLSQLFKISGKKGEAFGMSDPVLYFDGQRVLAANEEAVVWIDCPQPIDRAILIPVADIKTALMVSPTLSLRDTDGRVTANGVKVFAQAATDIIPDATLEIINLDRTIWQTIVRPFRFDGSRMAQVAPAAASGDIRFYLNGVFFDFAAGALVATDGHRMHIVEDAVQTSVLPVDTLQGVVMPASVVRILSAVGGVQDVFVLEKTAPATPTSSARNVSVAGVTVSLPAGAKDAPPVMEALPRLICIGVANAKFRVRAVDTASYVRYREPFDRNREHPIKLVLSAEDTLVLATVARVAGKNPNFPGVTIQSESRRITVSHLDRIERSLAISYQVTEPFTTTVNARYLLGAINAAGSFGSAVTMRYSALDGRGVYVGAQDFHAIVMTMGREEVAEEKVDAEATGLVVQQYFLPNHAQSMPFREGLSVVKQDRGGHHGEDPPDTGETKSVYARPNPYPSRSRCSPSWLSSAVNGRVQSGHPHADEARPHAGRDVSRDLRG